jgi:hypothetical protein
MYPTAPRRRHATSLTLPSTGWPALVLPAWTPGERTAMLRPMPPADLPLPMAIMAEVDRLARRPLWPTFEPRQTPVAIVHEAQTFLFRHPAPPPGFQPWPGFPGRTER